MHFFSKGTASALLQLDLRFLDDSNSWNVNGKPQHCEEDVQEY